VFDLRRLTPLGALVVLLLVVALLGSAGSEAFQRTVTTALIFVAAVVALYLFAGNSGVLMFGHAAFMAVGAYTVAILSIPTGIKDVTLPNLPGLLAGASAEPIGAVLISGGVAALLALLVGFPLMRLHHIAAAIGTLSLLVVVHVVISNWENVTNGPQTLVGVPMWATIWNTLPWVLGVTALTFAYQESRWGRRLRASREDLLAAQATGINVTRERMIAFVLSAFCLGIAGALLALFLGAFGPNEFYFRLTFLTLAMLIIGGLRSLSGAVVGALVISALSEYLRQLQDSGIDLLGLSINPRPGLREIVLAALMLAMLLLRPRGLTGGHDLEWPGLRSRRPQPVQRPQTARENPDPVAAER
jgi:branched-chain amino acid transport system permease protein